MARGVQARSAVDPMLAVRAKGAGGSGGGVVCETMSYQDAIKQETVLGNEPEREIQGLLGVITLLSGPYLVVRTHTSTHQRSLGVRMGAWRQEGPGAT